MAVNCSASVAFNWMPAPGPTLTPARATSKRSKTRSGRYITTPIRKPRDSFSSFGGTSADAAAVFSSEGRADGAGVAPSGGTP